MPKQKIVVHSEKFLAIITGLFVAVLLISNIASTKVFEFLGLVLDGGTILFPLSYIFGDILTEVYGYRKSRKVIWIGFFSALLMSVVFLIVGALPPAAGWENQQAFEAILGFVPRLVIASLIAYFAGEFSNSFILAKMKILTKGKRLWTRTIGSTVVGQGIDTALFATIAFWGVLPLETFVSLVVSNYVFKVGVEVLFTPATYGIVGFLKREEKMDVYDYNTDFTPFRLE
ncbi:transporter [Candidatus Kaiserbacteria bacterium GWA2_50_9]|uniref:Probable queuosine precursor transporter n=1 Tax=Candidatus Kaiserbacteria bacterium GWA2_50_9 TaxID=1798474 RepID=A0A1F6BWD3_9BACT|nr:MAG: transporter [Candidatus Kaiserbacteria bacterium GWA2_50_9]HZX34822.1 queuosine precursor transporter [archaeon]